MLCECGNKAEHILPKGDRDIWLCKACGIKRSDEWTAESPEGYKMLMSIKRWDECQREV